MCTCFVFVRCVFFFVVVVRACGVGGCFLSFREVNAQTSPLEGDGTFVASFPEGGHVLGKVREGGTEGGVVVHA